MTKEDLVIGRRYYSNKYDHSEGILKITKIKDNKVYCEVDETGWKFPEIDGEIYSLSISHIGYLEPCCSSGEKCFECKRNETIKIILDSIKDADLFRSFKIINYSEMTDEEKILKVLEKAGISSNET